MKRKLLCTLLCVTMAFSTLAGCGAKETTSTNVVVEKEEIETQVENEESTVEEQEVTNNEIIVEDERPEGAVVGETYTTDWGTYTIVDSVNGLDNIEVEFYAARKRYSTRSLRKPILKPEFDVWKIKGKEKLTAYRNGEISADEFRNWFMDDEWTRI